MKKVISGSEKVRLVLSSFQMDTNITKFCAQNGISRSSLYRWRRLVLAGLSTLMYGMIRGDRNSLLKEKPNV